MTKQYVPKLIPGAGPLGAYQQNGENQNPARYIPADAYISARDLIQRADPTQNGPAIYPRREAVEHLLNTLLEVTGITKYQLGKIMGCKHDSYVWKWFNGARRTGALYLTRMLHLLMLALPPEPPPIDFIRSVDWATSEITWRTGLTTKDDHYWPGFNADKKNQGERVPRLVGGVEFKRNRKEIPVQKAPARKPDSSI